MVKAGRVETWEIAREAVDGWGRGEWANDVTKKGEMDGSVVVDGRQGMDGMGIAWLYYSNMVLEQVSMI